MGSIAVPFVRRLTLDQRLVAQFDWSHRQPTPHHLCLYAVLLARIDQDRPTQSSLDELLNMRLAMILGLGFNPQTLTELERWDSLMLVTRLHRPQFPQERLRIARQVGDQALFIASQDLKVGRTRQHGMSVDRVIDVGQQAYRIAAGHLSRWPENTAQVLEADLADHFIDRQHLLDRAGHILGFDTELAKLIEAAPPPVSIDDVLEALSSYTANQDIANWDRLADLANRHHWLHPDFVFTLPPRPTA